ncbi:MAG TPA: hypothetical protein DD671_02685, partial [Balneolaceae bacterium]|nr:hypothetical protein [Balneolaceae bacterium]
MVLSTSKRWFDLMCGRYVLYEELDEINHFLNSMDSG